MLVKRGRNHTGEVMIIPIRCFTCGKVVSSSYYEYMKRVQEYQKAVEAKEKIKETPETILDDLGIDRHCCRRMIISHVNLIEDAAPYE